MSSAAIDDLIAQHLAEGSDHLRNCTLSELTRGECTRRHYFIFKIDLTGSTKTLKNFKPAAYARLAHAYLSTVDRITQNFGAEPGQTEYHGDGVLALFPERGNVANDVLTAAIQAHYSVNKLRHEVGIASLHPKVLLHFAPLAVAKIGPWNETHRVAMGVPIHVVAHKEKEINAGLIWTSDAFAQQLERDIRNKLLVKRTKPVTTTEWIREEPPPAIPATSSTYGFLGDSASHLQILSNALAARSAPPIPDPSSLGSFFGNLDLGALSTLPPTPTPVASRLGGLLSAAAFGPVPGDTTTQLIPAARLVQRNVTKEEPDGYTVRIVPAYNALKLPLVVLK